MRLLVIDNPHSGSTDQLDVAAALTDAGHEVAHLPIADAAAALDADEDHGDIAAGNVDRVVVSGGDGSLGVAAQHALQRGVPLAVVPSGTANDFARALKLPADQADAAALAARAAARTTAVAVGLVQLRDDDGPVRQHAFVNVLALGVAPVAAQSSVRLKRVLRALAYPVGAAVAIVRASPRRSTVHVNGREMFHGDAWQIMVAGTGMFGGVGDTGAVRMGDEQLDVFVLPAGRGAAPLVGDAAAMLRGTLAERSDVVHARGTTFDIVLRRAHDLVIDGELRRAPSRRVHIEVAPDTLEVVVPDVQDAP